MAVSKALKRLLRVRGLEEEQRRAALESALADLRRIETGLEECCVLERRGRDLMRATQETAERVAGRVELDAAQRRARVLAVRRTEAERLAMQSNAAFLEARVERRQAETLVEEAQTRENIALAHSAQQSLDEWHAASAPAAANSARRNRAKDEEIVSEMPGAIPNTEKGFHF